MEWRKGEDRRSSRRVLIVCARGGNRTLTAVKPRDFESRLSTNSNTLA